MEDSKFPGGTITKVSDKKWIVNAPDGREVGVFSRKRDAIAKAQTWDKWDAFGSLLDINKMVMPNCTSLMMDIIINHKTPTDKQMSVQKQRTYHLLLRASSYNSMSS